MILTGAKLEEIACDTFGAHWPSVLGDLWGVTRQTMFNMKKSQRGHPVETKQALLEAARTRLAIIAGHISDLEEDLGL